MTEDKEFIEQAIRLAEQNIREGGRPFGAILVKDSQIVATGVNEMHLRPDPTAHAELLAIKAASAKLSLPDLSGTTMYASGQPCPMCMAAMRLAGVDTVIFAYSNEDGERFGLSTAEIQAELARPHDQQSMKIRHLPHHAKTEAHLYEFWQQVQQEQKQ